SRNHIVTSLVEHHAVLETCRSLEEQGFAVTYLQPDEFGMISPESVRAAISDRTGLASIIHANNDVGTVNPIGAIDAIAGEREFLFHTDAVQSFGKIPLDVEPEGIDLMSLSAHKIYGPKGIGATYIRRGIPIDRVMHGGGQERGKRAGTENVPLAVGFAKAA